MKRMILPAAAVLAVCAAGGGQFDLPGGGPALPEAPSGAAARVNGRAVPSHTHVRPGQTFHLAVDLHLDDGWVYYSPRPGAGAGFEPRPASVTLRAEGLAAGPTLWPAHQRYRYALGGEALTNSVYKGRTIIYVPVTADAGASSGARDLDVVLDGQVCGGPKGAEQCLPLDAPEPLTLHAAVTVADASQPNPAWRQDPNFRKGLAEALPADRLGAPAPPGGQVVTVGGAGQYGLWAGLGLAVLAGLILNVMPCVLPVIPLRILSIVQMARDSRRRFVTLGLAFAGGILLFFVALAGVNAVLRGTLGQTVDLNEHFKYPPVRIAIAMILVALAANLFGVFHVVVPSSVASLGDRPRRRGGHAASAGMGLMMAVLATPCSFAVLATALAWAQLQPLWVGTAALGLIGAGMAAPHAVLAAFPDLLKRLPKPGRWMELLKQAMGFVLLPVVIWLLGTLSTEAYPFWVAAWAVVLVFCLWAWANWVRYDALWPRKLLVRGSAVLLAVAAGVFMLRPAEPLATTFQPYDPAALAAAREADRPVLVKFTASWCTSCRAVDYAVYDDPRVARQIAARGVLALKADVTNSDSPSARFLYRRVQGAPPLTVLFLPDDRTVRLVGKFDKSKLLDVLERLPAPGEAPSAS
jgi:thiol:disulfide interchange protein